MGKPTVIAILSLNNVDLLKQCLESVFENTTVPYRVCVVNQASSDGTKEYLDSLGKKVDAVHLSRNLGFVGGNNLVMERYPENDIVLLNNDTLVKKGWLKALHDCAYSDPRIGIVGAKLLYPDGRLQEAGGEIFQDGSGRNIGKFDDPNRYIYNIRRDVDYCSGACLFIKRKVLDEIGYLDEIFSPAYWEDTDICFRARKQGWRVVYEPTAEVIHIEGATSGLPSYNTLSRKLQERNKPKFMARWGEELKRHRKNVFEIRSSTGRDKILIILPFLPMYDRAAGEKRWFNTLKILNKYFDIVFLARNGAGQLKYINELEKMGITVFHTDQTRLRNMGCEIQGPIWIDFPLLLKSNDFKAIIVGFHHVAHQYWRDIRTYSSRSVFIIDSYDLAFIRERRRARISGDPALLWKAIETKRLELEMYKRADMVLTVTEEDRRLLLEEVPWLRVGISTDIHPLPEARRKDRGDGIVFVGNYNHDPNEDAVIYFVQEILPHVKRDLPHVKFYIVGNNPTEKVKRLAAEDIIVTGFVPEVTPYLMSSRVFVVPLRYGSGLKGKIGEALAAGIPIVTTSIGAEGMNLTHGRNALIADDPEDFAREVINVYKDDELWDRLSNEGRIHAQRHYSFEAAERYWLEIIDFIKKGRRGEAAQEFAFSKEDFESSGFKVLPAVPEIEPNVSIVVPVHNNLADTRTCWTSIKKNTTLPFRLIIVDNGSDEDIAYEADQNNIEVIRNETNTGFANACNQGIRHTHGDYIVILNNDTIVTPGWLERLLWHMQRDPKVGIVAPSTNFAASVQQIPTSYKTEKDLYNFSENLYARNRHQAVDVEKVVGVCMLLRRSMLEEIGLFDTRFGPGNYEDDDLCLRARLAGYKILWAKDVFVHHAGSKTFRAIGINYEKLMEENRRKFFEKWRGLLDNKIRDARDPNVKRDLKPLLFILPSGEELVSHVANLDEFASDMNVVKIDGKDGLADQILEKITEEAPETIFFVMGGAHLTPDWEKGLISALQGDGVGCALAASNAGWGKQFTKPKYKLPGKPLFRFARKNSLEWQGRVIDVDIGYPVAFAIGKEVLLGCKPSRSFSSAAVLLELEQRIKDRGLRIVCARQSYIHMSKVRPHPEELAVMSLFEGRRALSTNDIDSALVHFDQALKHMPMFIEALYEKGVVLALNGRSGEAVSVFKHLLEIAPEDSRAWNNLGCLLFEGGRIGEAEQAFETAINLDGGNWEAMKNLGDLYLRTGKAETAGNIFSSLIAQHGHNSDVYSAVAETFASLGDLETAGKLCEMALTISQDDKRAKSILEALRTSSKKS